MTAFEQPQMVQDDRDTLTTETESDTEHYSAAVQPDLLLSAYHYYLPEERIAQNPVTPRDSSRLLVVDAAPRYRHQAFRDLADLLQPGDLLVMNNTRVLPARLYGHKVGGSKIEILLLEEKAEDCWLALVKPGRRLKVGAHIEFTSPLHPEPAVDSAVTESTAADAPTLKAEIIAVDEATSGRLIRFEIPEGRSLVSLLQDFGQVPLPPYITASAAAPEQYQTVYGDRPGSAAAPTAGLHFTPELLERLTAKGIDQAFVTLHVGVGTFRPVEVETITEHQMHGEWLEIPAETVEKVQQTKARGGRVIAVGTTSVRALEGAVQMGELKPYCGKTNLFIYPGYHWQVVEGMITNFHLPKSSLMMLVSALIGRDRLLELYAAAIAAEYRFYSFGDAMLILPEAKLNYS